MKRKTTNDCTHLTLEARKIIQAGIENGATKADIARTIGKDATTVAKEIRKHRKFKPRNTYARSVLCGRRLAKKCRKNSYCNVKCEHFEEPSCKRRDKSPGACNKCPDTTKCHMDRYYYSAVTADQEYRRDLVDYREGIDLTTKERDTLAAIIAPLLKNGQSVYQILSAHPEIKQCQKTIYTYIETGVFKDYGIDSFSLKEQVNRKQLKNKLKKRKEPANYEGRRYSDYLHFCAEHPEVPTVEMDTLYNSQQGPFLQTLLFKNTAFMIGFLHKQRTSENMAGSIDTLQSTLGNDLFSLALSLLLADRGSEFELHKLFELDKDGNTRLNIFYCDPMQANQKPHVENGHNYVRDIIPNGYPLDKLTQIDIDLMFSHINATPRLSLAGRSPYELFRFFYGVDTPKLMNICEIKRDDVVLKPQLIFNKRS